MSWAKVMKINSDMSEPLNYMHYIEDIAENGFDSYVLDPSNAKIWSELTLRSTHLYGYKAIRPIIYENLTDAILDSLFNISPKLGAQLNSYHDTTMFASGNITDVMVNMNIQAYNLLKLKFMYAYSRYCTNLFKKNDEYALGQLILDTFGDSNFIGYNNYEEIIQNADKWSKVMANEALLIALTASQDVIDYLCTNPIGQNRLEDCMFIAGQNPVVVKTIAKYPELIDEIVDDQNLFSKIASNTTALTACLEEPAFADAILNNEDAINTIAANIASISVLCKYFADIQISKDSLEEIYASLLEIEKNSDNIYNEQDPSYMESLEQAKLEIEEALADIKKATDTSTLTLAAITKILSSKEFCLQVASNEDIVRAIAAEFELINAFLNPDIKVGIEAFVETNKALNILMEYSVATDVIAKNTVFLQEVLDSANKAENGNILAENAFVGAGAGRIRTDLLEETQPADMFAGDESMSALIVADNDWINAMIREANQGRPYWLNAFINNRVSMTALSNCNKDGEDNDALELILGNDNETSEDILFNSKEVALDVIIDYDNLEVTPTMLKILGDTTFMAKAIEDEDWMGAISKHQTWLNNLFLVPEAMEAIAASETAMTKFANEEISMNAILDSEIAMNKIVANTSNAMPIILASEIAKNLIVVDPEMMAKIANNPDWVNAIFNTETENSLAWIKAIVNNKTSLEIVLDNETFENAMVSSPYVRAEVLAIKDEELIRTILSDERYLLLIANDPTWMAEIANNEDWLRFLFKPENKEILLKVLSYDVADKAFLASTEKAKPIFLENLAVVLESNNFTSNLVNDANWMDTISLSNSFIGTMIANSNAVNKIANSSIASREIVESQTAVSVCLTANNEYTQETVLLQNDTFVTELSKNPTAMGMVAGSQKCINVLVANPRIMNILAQEEAAYHQLNNSQIALNAIFGNPTIRDIYLNYEEVSSDLTNNLQSMQYIANHSEYAEDALLHKVLSQRIVITNNAMTAFATSANGKIAIENNETIKYTVMNSELGAVKMLAGYIGINVDAVKDLKEFSQLFGNSTYALQMVNNNNCLNILLNYNLPASKWPYSLPMINAFMTSENALTLMADSQIAMSNVVRSSDAMVNFATHGIAMREIATSEIAMFALMTTTEAIRRTILSKDTPVNAFAISPTAMQIIANDKEWMDDICSIETAINGFVKVENSMNAFLANDLVAEVSMIDEPTGTTRAAILNNINNIAMPRVLSDPTMMKKIAGNATWMAAIAADSDWMDAAAANETTMKAFMNDSNAETKLIENTVVAMKEILENTSVAMDIVLTDVSMLEAIGNNQTWREAVVNNPDWMYAIANTGDILEAVLNTTSFENTVISNTEVALPAIISSTEVAMDLCLSDSSFMDKAMADEKWVYAIVNSPAWFARLLESDTAIESMSKSPLAMNTIAMSRSAMEKIVQTPKAYKIFNGSTIALKAILDSGEASTLYLKGEPLADLIGNPTGIHFIVNNIVYLLNFLSSDTARIQLFNSPVGMLETARSPLAMSTIVSTANYVTELKTLENSYKIINGESNALNAILSNPTATLNYLTDNALADLVQNPIGMNYIANNNSYIVTLLLNPSARVAMDTSNVVTEAINNSSYALDAIFNNANAVISFFKDNLLTSVITSTYAMNHICNTKDYINIMLLNNTARAAMDTATVVQRAINTSTYALNTILTNERATKTFLTGGLLSAMASSYDAMEYIANNETHLNTVYSNGTARVVLIETIASMDEIGSATLDCRDVIYYHDELDMLMGTDMSAAKFIAGYAGLNVYNIHNLYTLMASASNAEAILANDQAFDLLLRYLLPANLFAGSISAVTTLTKPEYLDNRLIQAVESYIFMFEIANSQTAMNPIATNRDVMMVVAYSENAMSAIAKSQNGMAGVIGNTTALGIIVESAIARDKIIIEEVGLNAMINNDASWEAIKNNDFWIDAILANEIASGIFFRNPRAWELILSSSLLQQRIAANQEAMYALLGADAAHHTDIVNTETFWTAFVAYPDNFLNALIWKTNLDNCVSHEDFIVKTVNNTALITVIAASSTAMTAIAASKTALDAIWANKIATDAICAGSAFATFVSLQSTLQANGYAASNAGSDHAVWNGKKVFIANGQTIICNYSGAIKNLYLCPGTYLLEVYGAQGGNSTLSSGAWRTGAKGGYAKGTIAPTTSTLYYICVGGKGGSSTTVGYNGGGAGANYSGNEGGAGGGCTHIANTNNTLAAKGNKSGLYIVAGGGGGGAGYSANYGCAPTAGGGDSGEAQRSASNSSCTIYSGGPGTQSSGGAAGNTSGSLSQGGKAGAFGQGGGPAGTSYYGIGGGGGGLYGGGAGCYTSTGINFASGGGGGSGYIGGVTGGSMSSNSRSGNGLARITRVSS